MPHLDSKDLMTLLVAVIAASAALIGALTTAIFSHLNTRATLREQRQLRADELRIQRMEELFVIFDQWMLNTGKVYLLHLQRHAGRLTTSEVHEIVEKSSSGLEKGEMQRMQMIIKIHFPELWTIWEEVQSTRRSNTPFLNSSSTKKFQEFRRTQENFEAACERFKESIAGLPRHS